jgi:hypothetical protein
MTLRPNTAAVSHSASPIHMAASSGMTLRQPLVRTRATKAATLGPGELEFMKSAPANMARTVISKMVS